jgi:membrane protease YdiL (CAAX protease family)
MNFFIGLAEELLVRGLILGMLIMKWGNTKKGVYQSVIVSSLIFGCAHLGNIIIDPSLLVATLSQVLYATFIGVFFAACVLRSQSIWPAIILHATIDFVSQLQQITIGGGIETANQVTASVNLLQAMQPIIIYGMLASYGFFLLKKVTPVVIESKYTNQVFKCTQQTTKD